MHWDTHFCTRCGDNWLKKNRLPYLALLWCIVAPKSHQDSHKGMSLDTLLLWRWSSTFILEWELSPIPWGVGVVGKAVPRSKCLEQIFCRWKRNVVSNMQRYRENLMSQTFVELLTLCSFLLSCVSIASKIWECLIDQAKPREMRDINSLRSYKPRSHRAHWCDTLNLAPCGEDYRTEGNKQWLMKGNYSKGSWRRID